MNSTNMNVATGEAPCPIGKWSLPSPQSQSVGELAVVTDADLELQQEFCKYCDWARRAQQLCNPPGSDQSAPEVIVATAWNFYGGSV